MSWNLPQKVIDGWLEDCRLAVKDEIVFDSFRRLNHITYVAETRHGDEVKDLWRRIDGLDPALRSLLPKLERSDRLGNPFADDLGMIGGCKVSGTTSHSLLRVGQMRGLFGGGPFHVVEIGGGYGNLAHVMYLAGMVKTYTGFDLMEPSLLQQKYLNRQGWVGHWPGLSDFQSSFDLCVSCTSLSELDQVARDEYVTRILRRSRCGFHFWNWGREGYHTSRTPQDDLCWFNEAMYPTPVVYEDGVFAWGMVV